VPRPDHSARRLDCPFFNGLLGGSRELEH